VRIPIRIIFLKEAKPKNGFLRFPQAITAWIWKSTRTN